MTAIGFVLINLLVDMTYAAVDREQARTGRPRLFGDGPRDALDPRVP